MLEAASDLQFEKAAGLRDQLGKLREMIAAEEAIAEIGDGAEPPPVMIRRSEIEAAMGGRKPKRKQRTGAPGAPGTTSGKRAKRRS
jgi:hypothetical protein